MKMLSLIVQRYFGLMFLSVLLGIVILMAAAGSIQKVQARPLLATRTFTIRNNCSYTIYPGIYPASAYSNGGWSMAPGASVSFNIPDGSNGRLWGRTGCNSASPAVCTTGSCGGTGLQCAGTTGFPNTSLFEWNINAGGTDWYNVSYVDAVDNPIGVQVSNTSCVSPNSCSNAVLTNCPADLRSGNVCLSPCTRYNTDQYCCRGAYGTPETCNVSQWAASAQTYVNNIHSYCPRQYAYAYDEVSGGALHTCTTGTNYTVTFCPAGGGGGPAGYTFCANENGTCSFSGTASVAYGANGAFNYRTATSSIGCNNATFGDPISGTAKACYYLPQPTNNWTNCASENGTCSFSGTMAVRYGANNSYFYRTATNSIACNNATFGDPIPGTVKQCDYSPQPPNNSWTQCAGENGTCSFSGARAVAYGANGAFFYRSATGSIACNNATFGDPIPGTVKACYYK